MAGRPLRVLMLEDRPVGCSQAQGYCIGRPIPVAELGGWHRDVVAPLGPFCRRLRGVQPRFRCLWENS